MDAEDDSSKKTDESSSNEENPKNRESFKKLPNTATTIYTALLIGLLLIASGKIMYYMNHRKSYNG